MQQDNRLDNAQALASLLGLRSVRHTSNILNMWHKRLTEEERTLLQDYCSGLELPDMDDPFLEYHFSVNLGEFGGMLLRTKSDRNLNLYTVKRKEIYKCCVKALNKDKLNGKVDTTVEGEVGCR